MKDRLPELATHLLRQPVAEVLDDELDSRRRVLADRGELWLGRRQLASRSAFDDDGLDEPATLLLEMQRSG